MKYVNNIIGVVILVGIWSDTLGVDVTPASCIEKQLLDLFTKWRQGDPLPLPLPRIEVIEIPNFEGKYSGYGIKVAFETGEMKLAGVNNFNVEELLASVNNTLKASGSIQFPLLTLTADNYNLKGRAYVFYTLKGSGLMYASFENVKLMFGIILGPRGGGTQVKDIRLNFSVDRVKVDLAGSSWPINKVLNAEALHIIESYHNEMVNAATDALRDILNKYLSTVAPEQLTKTFVGKCKDFSPLRVGLKSLTMSKVSCLDCNN